MQIKNCGYNRRKLRRGFRRIKIKVGTVTIVASLHMYNRAKALNDNLPASEVWFQELFKNEKFPIKLYTNIPIGNYIADLANVKHRIALEIDGSYHDLPGQKYKDQEKTDSLIARGYRVYRIKAYDIESYKETLATIRYQINLRTKARPSKN